jgi:hypothetical protein
MVASQASCARWPVTTFIVPAAYTVVGGMRPRIGYPGSW